jgi:hypothetical protein
MKTILIILTVITILIWIIILLISLKIIEIFTNNGILDEIDFTTKKISAVNIGGNYIKVFSLVNTKLRKIINTHNFGAGDIISISLIYIPLLNIGIVYQIRHIIPHTNSQLK